MRAVYCPLALTCPSCHSPADADGAFMAKLMPAFQKVTLAGVDDSDDTSLNMTSDTTDTTYGGDIFFNLTRCVW